MEIPDSIKVLVDLKGHSDKGFDYIPILLIVLSGTISFVIAYFTSRWTRKNEIDKIKAEQDNLKHKVDYDLKQMLIAIETDNYRLLYEKKLETLKKIKEIQFTVLESDSEHYDSVDEFMRAFPFKELVESIRNLIIEYSYIFNAEIVALLKDIYHDSEFTMNNYDPESSDWYNYSDRIFKKFHDLVTLVTDDLKIDLNSIEKKVK
jgi:hypothetical protein